MTNRLLSLLLCAIFGAIHFPVQAQSEGPTIQNMIRMCKEDSKITDFSNCAGMASGVFMTMVANRDNPGAVRVCTTLSVSNGQIIQIFLNWAKDHPEEWQGPAPFGFILALQEKLPCR